VAQVLILNGFEAIDPNARFHDLRDRHAEIPAPSSSGFGRSSRP
jgi:hypothetical protein